MKYDECPRCRSDIGVVSVRRWDDKFKLIYQFECGSCCIFWNKEIDGVDYEEEYGLGKDH